MKLDLQGGLAPLSVDKAGRGEDVVEGADEAFMQTLPTNKAKPGGIDVVIETGMVGTLPFGNSESMENT